MVEAQKDPIEPPKFKYVLFLYERVHIFDFHKPLFEEISEAYCSDLLMGG